MIYKCKENDGAYAGLVVVCDENDFRGIALNSTRQVKQYRWDCWDKSKFDKLDGQYKVKLRHDPKNLDMSKPFVVVIENKIYFHEAGVDIVDVYNQGATRKFKDISWRDFEGVVKDKGISTQRIILKNK